MQTNSTPPPRGLPQVILKEKECYTLWQKLHRDFPRVERLGIGQKIENIFLFVLELTFYSAYLPLEPKILMLGKAISKLDILKFFIQLAWENKLISTDQHIELSQNLEEIGRQLGGWKKGLEAKLPSK
ncbi:MAG: four helix bundle protein [Candidatus Paceibacterota bacterium]|jgi:hypothetical protein